MCFWYDVENFSKNGKRKLSKYSSTKRHFLRAIWKSTLFTWPRRFKIWATFDHDHTAMCGISHFLPQALRQNVSLDTSLGLLPPIRISQWFFRFSSRSLHCKLYNRANVLKDDEQFVCGGHLNLTGEVTSKKWFLLKSNKKVLNLKPLALTNQTLL